MNLLPVDTSELPETGECGPPLPRKPRGRPKKKRMRKGERRREYLKAKAARAATQAENHHDTASASSNIMVATLASHIVNIRISSPNPEPASAVPTSARRTAENAANHRRMEVVTKADHRGGKRGARQHHGAALGSSSSTEVDRDMQSRTSGCMR